jgi:hypothetical protein
VTGEPTAHLLFYIAKNKICFNLYTRGLQSSLTYRKD